MPLRINVLTGTPIAPDGSTSIYDILFTRKHEKPLEEQRYIEDAIYKAGFEIGFQEGLSGLPLYDNPNARYQVYIERPDQKLVLSGKRKVGFEKMEDAIDFIRNFTGDMPMTNDEIYRKLNTREGVRVRDLVFRWKHHDIKTGEERRMGSLPNIKFETGPPPPKLPLWKAPPTPPPQPKSAKSPAKKRGRPKKNG
jgi:hypothetical protein